MYAYTQTNPISQALRQHFSPVIEKPTAQANKRSQHHKPATHNCVQVRAEESEEQEKKGGGREEEEEFVEGGRH
jgi:hypothetical protein